MIPRGRIHLSDLGTQVRDPETKEEMLLFYGGPFSQWAACGLVIDGVFYNCAEQYMMAKKALVFRDLVQHQRIMASSSPSDQKAFGRLVEGFRQDVWDSVSRDVVRTASLVKFNLPRFRRALLATNDLTLVEASPTDVIWGIGYSEMDPEAAQRSGWRGTNWLGEVLMDVRRALRGER